MPEAGVEHPGGLPRRDQRAVRARVPELAERCRERRGGHVAAGERATKRRPF